MENEHEVTWEPAKYTGVLRYTVDVVCNCGWTATAKGEWPSEARRQALVVGLNHRWNRDYETNN